MVKNRLASDHFRLVSAALLFFVAATAASDI